MRALVCGGRDFGALPLTKPPHMISPGVYSSCDYNHPDYPARRAEYDFVLKTLYQLFDDPNPENMMGILEDTFIISGVARGVDQIASDFAVVNWLSFKEYPADWKKYGKRAGFIRNQRMLTEGSPDLVVAFPGGIGTAMMVRLAKGAGVPVIEVTYDQNMA